MSLKERLRVMIVDDTYTNRALIKDSLDQLGIMNSVVSKDGDSALKALMVSPMHLVISDLNMPGLDGMSLLRKLREFKPTSKIGFILVTASSDPNLLAAGKAYGLNNVLYKPFTTDGLKRSIESVVGRL